MRSVWYSTDKHALGEHEPVWVEPGEFLVPVGRVVGVIDGVFVLVHASFLVGGQLEERRKREAWPVARSRSERLAESKRRLEEQLAAEVAANAAYESSRRRRATGSADG